MERRRTRTQSKMKGRPRLMQVPLIAAVLLLSFSLYTSSPRTLVATSTDMLSSAVVGLSASVDPNPENTLAAQFAQKEAELQEREAALLRAENPTRSFLSMDSYALYSFILSILLFVLVALNYFFDWRRGRKPSVRESRIVVS